MVLQSWRVLCVGLAIMLSNAVRADSLRIGSWDRQTDPLVIVSEAVLTRAYAELRQPVEFVDLPIRRAMVMMLSSELDGNVYRIASLSQEQPGLFRIDPPVNAIEVRVYTVDPAVKADQWGQLAGLRVAHQRGVLVIERNLPANSRHIEAGSIVELLRLLQRGAVDVVLMVEPAHSKPHPLASAYGALRQDAIIERMPLHHYLLERHRDVGLRLAGVLKRMAASGELQAITGKALKAMD